MKKYNNNKILNKNQSEIIDLNIFHLFCLIKHKFSLFIDSLQNYVQIQLIQLQTKNFSNILLETHNLEVIFNLQLDFLQSSMKRIFLFEVDKFKNGINNRLLSMMKCCLQLEIVWQSYISPYLLFNEKISNIKEKLLFSHEINSYKNLCQRCNNSLNQLNGKFDQYYSFFLTMIKKIKHKTIQSSQQETTNIENLQAITNNINIFLDFSNFYQNQFQI